MTKARAGERQEALELLNAFLEKRPDHEDALLWKAALINDPAETIRCLERVLRINPSNQRARVGLEWAYKRRAETPEPAAPAAESAPAETPEPEVAPAPEIPARPVRPPTPTREFETKSAPPPYKKRRLNVRESHLPPVDLPPEAVEWTRPDRAERAARQREAPPEPAPPSEVLRAASPSVSFRIAPQVRQALSGKFPPPGGVRLRWPLLIFGGALAAAFLAFPLNVLAPFLGVIAIVLAISGVILFNRAKF